MATPAPLTPFVSSIVETHGTPSLDCARDERSKDNV